MLLLRRRLVGLIAAPLLVAQCAPPQCAPPAPPPATVAEAWANFDADLSSRLLGAGASAVSVAVHQHGQPVHVAAYGQRLPWSAEPTTTTDRFRVASISKVVTAIVVLQLVEAGYVGLDQAVGGTIAGHLGVAPADGRFPSITVRQLLSHTAGLGTFDSTIFGGTVGSCRDAARRAVGVMLGRTPGTGYRYSNMGYCLLGQLIEALTGRSYESVAREWVLAPLGISGMRVAGTGIIDGEVFHWQQPNRNYMDVLGPAGSWLATASDVVRIIDSLDVSKPGYHPLSPGMTDLMRAMAPFRPSPDRWYGLGLICFTDGTWGHTGTLESAHAMVLHRPDGLTWAILVSGDAPKESDDLKAMFDDVLTRAGVRPFLGI